MKDRYGHDTDILSPAEKLAAGHKREVDGLKAIIRALVNDPAAWIEKDDMHYSVCRYCLARVDVSYRDPAAFAVKCDHTPDCPVARGLVIIEIE